MRIVFIAPPSHLVYGSYKGIYKSGFLNPPLNLCYLASAVEKDGHTARILDADAEHLALKDIIRETVAFRPGLVGVTVTSLHMLVAEEIGRSLKEALPSVPLILGGPHVNLFGVRSCEDDTSFDYCGMGDGEKVIVALAAMLSGGGDQGSIPGLIRRVDAAHVMTTPPTMEKDLDNYSFPARHLIQNERYIRGIPYEGYKVSTAFMSSRGCPYGCTYCATEEMFGGRKARLRSAENVLDELEVVVKDMGITHVSFNDDCFTLNKRRVYDICEGIHDRGLDFTWEGLSRADLVDRDMMRAMKRAGLVRFSFGIESGNQKILDSIQKGETLDEIEEAIRVTKEEGIVTRGSIIIGVPYETSETIKDTKNFILRLKELDQVNVNILQPYPGTKVRKMILAEEGGARMVANRDRHDELRRFGSSSVEINDLTPASLVQWQRRLFLEFYIRPLTLWNNFRISGTRAFFQDGFNFIRGVAGA